MQLWRFIASLEKGDASRSGDKGERDRLSPEEEDI